MSELKHSYTPHIDKVIFDELLKKAESSEFNKGGSNSKCAIIDNYAILRTSNIPGHDDSFTKMINALQDLKKKGVNVVPILGYGIIELGQIYDSGKRYDKGYIVQEKAPGKELLHVRSELKHKSEEECRKIVLDYIKLLDTIPQEHYDKWVSDFKAITDGKVQVDPSKESNFFYDEKKGFCFIDLNFFTSETLFDKVDANGEVTHEEFILYTLTPFRHLFGGVYDKYLKTSEELEFSQNVAAKCLERYFLALTKLGVTERDMEFVCERYNMPMPELGCTARI